MLQNPLYPSYKKKVIYIAPIYIRRLMVGEVRTKSIKDIS